MSQNKPTLLEQAKSIPVPQPGTGEIVILPSVEALCVWMKANNLKALHWHGEVLVVAAEVDAIEQMNILT